MFHAVFFTRKALLPLLDPLQLLIYWQRCVVHWRYRQKWAGKLHATKESRKLQKNHAVYAARRAEINLWLTSLWSTLRDVTLQTPQ